MSSNSLDSYSSVLGSPAKIPDKVARGEGNIHKGGVFGDGEGGGSGVEERDLQLVAIIFTSIWFVFLTGYFVYTLMVKGRRNLKKRLKEGINDKWGYS